MKLLTTLITSLMLLSFAPLDPTSPEDTETYVIEEEFERHEIMWWLDSDHFPQEATFYIEVPAPDPFKDLSEIRLDLVEFIRHYLAVSNLSPNPGLVSTYDVRDTLTVSIRGTSDRILSDRINLIPQSADMVSYGYSESLEDFILRLASNTITNDSVLDRVEKFSSPITLVVQFNSNYDVSWQPDNLWFFHKLMIYSSLYGEFTYVYK